MRDEKERYSSTSLYVCAIVNRNLILFNDSVRSEVSPCDSMGREFCVMFEIIPLPSFLPFGAYYYVKVFSISWDASQRFYSGEQLLA